MQPISTHKTEVDFINLARTLWKGRKLIVKIMLVSMVLGFVVSIIIPKHLIQAIPLLYFHP